MRARRWAQTASIAIVLSTTVAAGTTAGATGLPPPSFGHSVNVGLVAGSVIVRPHGRRAFRLGVQDRSIPVGSVIDTTHGQVDLRSARGPTGSGAAGAARAVQDAQFSAGAFRVSQPVGGGGLTLLALVITRSLRRTCTRSAGAAAGRHLSRRVLQTLHAHDSGGRFRTRGRYSAGTVRGTTWVTTDRCDGTLTIVRRGTVDVRDFARRRTIAVHAGHHYLARAR